MLQGVTYVDHRDLGLAIKSLDKCLSLRKDCLYKHNQELVETGDRLAECYAMTGKFKEARMCLKTCLQSVSFR